MMDGLATFNVIEGLKLAYFILKNINLEIAGVFYKGLDTRNLLVINPYSTSYNEEENGKVIGMHSRWDFKATYKVPEEFWTGSPYAAFHIHPGHPNAVGRLGFPLPSGNDEAIAKQANYNGFNTIKNWCIFRKE